MRKLILAVMFLGVLFVSAYAIRIARFTVMAYEPHLKSKDSIINHNDTGLIMYDRHGNPFFTFYEAKHKETVSLQDISPYVRQSVVAVEDRHFLDHPGISPRGIIRAALWNYQEGRIVAGGSTLTQQLIKNSLLTPQKDFRRKFQEAVLALAIERHYSKADILEMYLNSVYFGQGAFGVEQASRTYFNKSARDLTLSEASFLTALLPAPSQLSREERIPDDTRQRQALVLQVMEREQLITPEQHQQALQTPLQITGPSNPTNTTAPHFALLVREQLIAEFGEQAVARSGFKVKTTLDTNWQQQAQEAVAQGVAQSAAYNANNGAAVVIEPRTGHVLALVGSLSWQNDRFGKMNMAIQPRQPGSSFKPFVYATAFEKRTITPATILHDKPTTFGKDYKPKNYDGRYRGNVLARKALVNSLNIPAVEVINKTGTKAVIDTATQLGISTLDYQKDANLSLALGSGEVSLLEMTGAYASFANNGYYQPIQTVISIIDRENNEVPFTANKRSGRQVISPGTAYLVSQILSDAKTRTEVFGPSLNTTYNAAVKTGTTQSYRDAWTIGFTPDISIGVWVGNNDNTPMRNLPGLVGAGPIWKNLTETFSTQYAQRQFQQPSTITALSICPWSGLPYRGPGQVGYQEYFLTGTEPQGRCTIPKPKPPEEEEKEDEEKENKEEEEEDQEQAYVPPGYSQQYAYNPYFIWTASPVYAYPAPQTYTPYPPSY